MKKTLLFITVTILILALIGCNKGSGTPGEESISETLDFLPRTFTYSDATGEWSSVISVNPDGSFSGSFISNAEKEATDEYPGGTVYYSDFSGRFTQIKKANDFSYSMYLESVSTQQEKDQVTIESGIRYISSSPLGISAKTEYILYTPDTPINALPELFLFWCPFITDENSNLYCYAIRNTHSDEGFYAYGD